jgi:hypothetical protein
MEQPEMDSEVAEDLLTEEDNQDVDLLADSDNLDDEKQTEEESEEVDIDGHKISLPKSKAEKLKAERLMQADYTRKTQEVADQRRVIEAEREQFQRQVQEQQVFIQEIAQLTAVNNRIEQFEQIDWTRLSNEDPVEAQKLFFEYSQLKDVRNNLHGTLTQKQQQRQFEEQQKHAKRLEDGRLTLEREIKDWSPELAAKLAVFARDEGWNDAEITNITPAQVKQLHKLYIGSQVLKKQTEAKNVTQIKPVTRVGSTSSVKKDPTKMTDDEFNAWRRSQIKRSR